VGLVALLSIGAVTSSGEKIRDIFADAGSSLVARGLGAAEEAQAALARIFLAGATLPEGDVGQPYAGFDLSALASLSPEAGFGTADLAWSADALPAGLSLDPATGALSGTPTEEGTGSYRILAAHADAETGEQVFTIVVNGIALKVTRISAGDSHSCAVTTSGAAKCWGANSSGQLGDGTNNASSIPVQVAGLESGVASISAAYNHTCAVTADGAAKCWGYGNYGRLGNGANSNSAVPVQVSGLESGVAAISAGSGHTCVVTMSGAARCWGRNTDRQLGDGSTTTRTTPVQVSGLASGVASISAGSKHTCAVTTSGSAKCWGSNSSGQLGDGSTSTRATPVQVSGLTSVVAAISAGTSNSCAVTTDGAAKCWGGNGFGQLGDGSAMNKTTPIQVLGLASGVAAISAGNAHTCAVMTDGAAKCWGLNGSGQLGDGSTSTAYTPVQVSGLASGAAAISAGVTHTCAVTTSGSAKCWGFGNSGRLGDGETEDRLLPVAVLK